MYGNKFAYNLSCVRVRTVNQHLLRKTFEFNESIIQECGKIFAEESEKKSKSWSVSTTRQDIGLPGWFCINIAFRIRMRRLSHGCCLGKWGNNKNTLYGTVKARIPVAEPISLYRLPEQHCASMKLLARTSLHDETLVIDEPLGSGNLKGRERGDPPRWYTMTQKRLTVLRGDNILRNCELHCQIKTVLSQCTNGF